MLSVLRGVRRLPCVTFNSRPGNCREAQRRYVSERWPVMELAARRARRWAAPGKVHSSTGSPTRTVLPDIRACSADGGDNRADRLGAGYPLHVPHRRVRHAHRSRDSTLAPRPSIGTHGAPYRPDFTHKASGSPQPALPINWLITARSLPGFTGLFSSGTPGLLNSRRHWSLRSAVMITAGSSRAKCWRKDWITSQPTTPWSRW
ncbi:hypothetical protein D3C81_1675070 [compost metagenome]